MPGVSRSLLDELPTVLTNVYLGLTTAFGFLRLVLLFCFCRRFGLFPIKDRWPYVGAVVQLGILIFTEIWMYEIYDWEHFPCWLDAFASHFLLFLTCGVFTMRALGLYWNYNKCVEALESERESLRQLKIRSPSRRRKWFLERRWIGSPKVLNALILFLAVCHFIEFLATVASAEIKLDTKMPDCYLEDRYIKLGIALFYATSCILLAIDMRMVADNFFIKNELAVVGWATSVGAAGWFLFDTLLSHINRKSALSLVVLYCASLVIFFASILYPLNKSIPKGILGISIKDLLMPPPPSQPKDRDSKYSIAPSRSGTQTELPIDTASFLAILRDPEACDSFSQFLIRELNVENLLFWQAVDRFRGNCYATLPPSSKPQEIESSTIGSMSTEEISVTVFPMPERVETTAFTAFSQAIDQASQIMTRFIRPDGELQVNLPALIFSSLNESFEKYVAPQSSSPQAPPSPPLTSVRSLPKLFGKSARALMGGSQRNLSAPPKKSQTSWQLFKGPPVQEKEETEVDKKATEHSRWEDTKSIATLFDEAQQEIFRLMRYDPFQRYARTEEGIRLRTKVATQEPAVKPESPTKPVVEEG